MTNQEDREQRPIEPIQAQEERERKKPEDMTDAELERLCSLVEEIIDKLSIMDQRSLTEERRKIRQEKLQQALDIAEVLEVEQMIRLVRKVQSRVLYRLALYQQKGTHHQRERRRGND